MRQFVTCLISRRALLCIPAVLRRAHTNMADLSGMRHPYHDRNEIFDVKDLVSREPFGQFQQWLDEALKINTIEEANAMSIATATKDGFPSVRMVLMKGFDKHGIVFYTNYGSRKARELEENPRCSLMFYWEPLKRSVRIEGNVQRIPDAESDAYFHSRPRASQIGALVSNQSTVIPSRESLDKRNEEFCAKYSDEKTHIPKPDYWGGYRVVPEVFEFWQGQTNRLHDRLRFRRAKSGESIDKDLTKEMDDGWLLERLSP